MKNPVLLLPEVLAALLAIDKIVASGNLPSVTRELVDLRASQINGCSVCVDIHSRELKKLREKDARIAIVAAPISPRPNQRRLRSLRQRPGQAIERMLFPTKYGMTRFGIMTNARLLPWLFRSP